MAQKICSGCGYEGSGKRAKASGGGMFRVLGMLTLLPFFSLWRLITGRSTNECPHCHMPMLVKMNSDAGRAARHRFDIELGLITPAKKKAPPTDPKTAFGHDQPAVPVVKKKSVDPEAW